MITRFATSCFLLLSPSSVFLLIVLCIYTLLFPLFFVRSSCLPWVVVFAALRFFLFLACIIVAWLHCGLFLSLLPIFCFPAMILLLESKLAFCFTPASGVVHWGPLSRHPWQKDALDCHYVTMQKYQGPADLLFGVKEISQQHPLLYSILFLFGTHCLLMCTPRIKAMTLVELALHSSPYPILLLPDDVT